MGKWLRRILLTFLIITPLVFFAGWYQSVPVHIGDGTDNFDGQRFLNQIETPHKSGPFIWWQITRKRKPWPKETISVARDNYNTHSKSNLLVTYVNHATTIIQTPAITIITDPIWSDRAGPFKYLGPKRIHKAGISFDSLPKIDAVLISHNHYDHLDIATLKKLKNKHNPTFIVGLGNKATLVRAGIDKVVELDWWETTTLKGVPIHFVPATHFSSRGFYDMDRTLWGGFVFPSEKGYVYFAGDTGWGPHFEAIAEKFKPMALSILPIGAYEPQWFMRPFHINPEQAVDAHILLESKQSIGVHWGTFRLSDEMRFEPIWDLRMALMDEYVSSSSFQALPPGASLEL